MDNSTTRNGASSAALWLISSLVICWLGAMAVSQLPPRAKPLLLLPIVIGAGLGMAVEKLRDVLGGPREMVTRIAVPLLVVGAMLLVTWNGYQGYLSSSTPSGGDQVAQGLARQMLRSTADADPELLRRYEAEIEAARPGPNQYLNRKFAPLGRWTLSAPWALLGVELILAAMAGSWGQWIIARRPDGRSGGASPSLETGSRQTVDTSSATSENHS